GLREQAGERHREAAGLGGADQLFWVGRALDLFDAGLERERTFERAAAERDPTTPVGNRALPISVGASGDAETQSPLLITGPPVGFCSLIKSPVSEQTQAAPLWIWLGRDSML